MQSVWTFNIAHFRIFVSQVTIQHRVKTKLHSKQTRKPVLVNIFALVNTFKFARKPVHPCHALRGVTRLDGARGRKPVRRPHDRTRGLSEANLLYLRNYLWHFCDFSTSPYWFGTPIVIRRQGNCAPLPPSLRPCMQ